jgi:hypothetical protein
MFSVYAIIFYAISFMHHFCYLFIATFLLLFPPFLLFLRTHSKHTLKVKDGQEKRQNASDLTLSHNALIISLTVFLAS